MISFLLFAFIMPGKLPWDGLTRPFLAYCTIIGSFSSWVGSSMYHLFMNHKKGEQFYDTLLMIDVIGIWITQSIGAATTITTSVLLYRSDLQVALITAYVFLSLRALRDVLTANSVWTRILGFSYLFTLRLLAFGLRIYAIDSGAASVSTFNLIVTMSTLPASLSFLVLSERSSNFSMRIYNGKRGSDERT